ncbi:MAG: thioesterase family protein [Alphaproteobacteria bacterium]
MTDDLTVPEVSDSLTAFSDMPRVFATAYMVAFAEAACIECIAPYRVEDEHTVGTYVDINHVAATPPGMEICAEVCLVEAAGRTLTFDVTLRDDLEIIGRGRHQRAVISRSRFEYNVQKKAENAVSSG